MRGIVIAIAMIATTAGAQAPAKREWTSSVWASASARNPRQDVRITAAGDTIANGTDYELVLGIAYELPLADSVVWARAKAVWIGERENGIPYLGQIYAVRVEGPKGEIGWELSDVPDDGLYSNRLWRSVFFADGRLGIGLTVVYFAPDFGDGHLMLHGSFADDSVGFGPLALSVRAEYDRAVRADRISAEVEVRNFAWGRYGLVPTASLARQNRKAAWRAKMIGRIGLK